MCYHGLVLATEPVELGSTGVILTRIGLGGAPLGYPPTKTAEKAVRRTIAAAWQAGIRYFDTAPRYGYGLSERRFGDALPSGWVYRSKTPDYGIDGEVEIFDADGSSTGISFNVQLRATDSVERADRVRLEVDELDYYGSLDVPPVVVRYGSPDETLYWQWASNIASQSEIADGQQTVTYRFGKDECWSEATPTAIRRTLEVRRRLANFPPSMAVSLRIDLSAIAAADRYLLDRMIARMLADSRGALVRAASTPADVEGVKYRTMQNPVFIEMFSALGGSPVPMAWGEVFTAMQQGTIDGLEIPASVVNSNNYADVTKYLSFTRHTYSAIHLLMAERTYDKLPDDVRDAVIKAGKSAIETQRVAVAAAEEQVVAALREKGMQINDIDDVAAFRAKVGPVYEQFKPTIGADLLDSALNAVAN